MANQFSCRSFIVKTVKLANCKRSIFGAFSKNMQPFFIVVYVLGKQPLLNANVARNTNNIGIGIFNFRFERRELFLNLNNSLCMIFIFTIVKIKSGYPGQ